MRSGIGFDAHRFEEGRRLVLCGVEIKHDKGLAGHSDADVATHALIDALLGAAALGDIGTHFPDGDPRFKDILSLKMLRHVCLLLKRTGHTISNADVTIIAQEPKLASRVLAMRETLAYAMEIDVLRVSVKATTTEGMGFAGRGEGIAAMAIATID